MPFWVKQVKTLLGVLVILGLGYLALNSQELFIDILSKVNSNWLILSLGSWVFSIFLSAYTTKQSLKTAKNELPFLIILGITAHRVLGRYQFSRSALMVGRSHDLVRNGIDVKNIATTFHLEIALGITAACFFGGILILFTRGLDFFGWLSIVSIICGSLWAVIVPLIFKMKPNKFAAVDEVQFFITLLSALLVVIVQSYSFYAYTQAFNINITNSPSEIMGDYALAWMFGSITFCLPLGLGMFEALLSQMLYSQLPLFNLVFYVAGFRFVQIIGDVFIYLMYLLTRLRPKRKF